WHKNRFIDLSELNCPSILSKLWGPLQSSDTFMKVTKITALSQGTISDYSETLQFGIRLGSDESGILTIKRTEHTLSNKESTYETLHPF
ncbi:MAG: hypothetical protein AAFN18_21220, partial [Cyanobacteria bacterium J06554_6]